LSKGSVKVPFIQWQVSVPPPPGKAGSPAPGTLEDGATGTDVLLAKCRDYTVDRQGLGLLAAFPVPPAGLGLVGRRGGHERFGVWLANAISFRACGFIVGLLASEPHSIEFVLTCMYVP
jgi:hypothetical protein